MCITVGQKSQSKNEKGLIVNFLLWLISITFIQKIFKKNCQLELDLKKKSYFSHFGGLAASDVTNEWGKIKTWERYHCVRSVKTSLSICIMTHLGQFISLLGFDVRSHFKVVFRNHHVYHAMRIYERNAMVRCPCLSAKGFTQKRFFVWAVLSKKNLLFFPIFDFWKINYW